MYLKYQDWLACKRLEISISDKIALLCKVTGWHREKLYASLQKSISPSIRQQLHSIETTLHRHYPIQYVLQYQHFYGKRILVNPHCLIPRICTEALVTTILNLVSREEPILILDLGTGSGCIALTLASHLPNSRVLGTDISEDALAVAERNKTNLGISNCNFIKSDWFELVQGRFDIVVSNPPYVSYQDVYDPQLCYEPPQALFVEEGTQEIKKIIASSLKYTRSMLVLEHAAWQAETVRSLMEKQGYYTQNIFSPESNQIIGSYGIINK